MREQLPLHREDERLVRTLSASHAWLGAHPSNPLVRATRRPPAATLRGILPAQREHILAPSKEAREQRYLALRRPGRPRSPRMPCFKIDQRVSLARGVQLQEAPARGISQPVEPGEPRFLDGYGRLEISTRRHIGFSNRDQCEPDMPGVLTARGVSATRYAASLPAFSPSSARSQPTSGQGAPSRRARSAGCRLA